MANISSGLPNRTITDITIHPNDENRFWITFSGYSDNDKVFYTNDSGQNWMNISDDLPNLPTNCILFYEPNETLFIGTDIGVFYRDSSMISWEMFNQGLPNVIVTELSIISIPINYLPPHMVEVFGLVTYQRQLLQLLH